jgi:dTDP-4-dehydrorhamnose 3,5-epimerase
MNIRRLSIPEVLLITPNVFSDHRGRFLEAHRSEDLAERAGIFGPFVQSNISTSTPWTIRGLHYQLVDPQGKLVRCIRGEIYDVAVDMREGSRTFGRWAGTSLNESDMAALWVPPGFAHGFLTLGQGASVHYECTSYYVEEYNRALKWNADDLGITWPTQGRDPVISNKDRAAPNFSAADKVTAV